MLDVKDWLCLKDLQSDGFNCSQIHRKTGFDRKTIRKYVNSTSEPEPKKRKQKETKLDRYRRHIDIGVNGIEPGLFFKFYAELFKNLSKPVDLVDLSMKSLFNELVEETGEKIYG